MKKSKSKSLTPEQIKALLATMYQELKTIFSELEKMPIKKKRVISSLDQKLLKDLETLLKTAFDHTPSDADIPLYTLFENNA